MRSILILLICCVPSLCFAQYIPIGIEMTSGFGYGYTVGSDVYVRKDHVEETIIADDISGTVIHPLVFTDTIFLEKITYPGIYQVDFKNPSGNKKKTQFIYAASIGEVERRKKELRDQLITYAPLPDNMAADSMLHAFNDSVSYVLGNVLKDSLYKKLDSVAAVLDTVFTSPAACIVDIALILPRDNPSVFLISDTLSGQRADCALYFIYQALSLLSSADSSLMRRNDVGQLEKLVSDPVRVFSKLGGFFLPGDLNGKPANPNIHYRNDTLFVTDLFNKHKPGYKAEQSCMWIGYDRKLHEQLVVLLHLVQTPVAAKPTSTP